MELNLERVDAIVANSRIENGRLDDIEQAVAELEQWRATVSTFSAQGLQGLSDAERITAVGSHGGLAWTVNKDTIIVALVVALICCFVAAFTACFGTQRQVGYGKVFSPEN